MASTQLELARRAHEEIERLDRLASKTLAERPPRRTARASNRIVGVDCVVTASADAAKSRRVAIDRAREWTRKGGEREDTRA